MRGENILKNLYYGKIIPWEKETGRDPEYTKLLRRITDSEKKLTGLFNSHPNAQEETGPLEQLMSAKNEIAGLCDAERFIEGFRIGARFMLDTFLIP